MTPRRNTDFIPQCVAGDLFLFFLQPGLQPAGTLCLTVSPSSFLSAEQKDGMCFVSYMYVSYTYRSHFSILPLLMRGFFFGLGIGHETLS